MFADTFWEKARGLLACVLPLSETGSEREPIRRIPLTTKRENPLREIPWKTLTPTEAWGDLNEPPSERVLGVMVSIRKNGYRLDDAIYVIRFPDGTLVSGQNVRAEAMARLSDTVPGFVMEWADLPQDQREYFISRNQDLAARLLRNPVNNPKAP